MYAELCLAGEQVKWGGLTSWWANSWSSGAFSIGMLMLKIIPVSQSTGSFFQSQNNGWNQNNVSSAVSLLWDYDRSEMLPQDYY